MNRPAVSGQFCKTIPAAILLLTVGCGQHSQVSDVRPINATNAKSRANSIALSTNQSPERFLGSTNAMAVEDDPRERLLKIWRSQDSTPEEVASALTKWLPKDTSIESVQALLGDGALSHHSGISFDSAPSENTDHVQANNLNCFILEYDLPRGHVVLRFGLAPGGGRFRFERAYAR